ncbi:MAG TPA: winged helix DNA-binding domain-containing protein [Candidatus Dormibacteraeota bacterium]
MSSADDVAARRLRTQRLTGEPFAAAVDAVRFLVAVQSQDYPGAKWGLGLRTRGVRDADLDALYDAGSLLRTHVMRPTWHFVLPDDIRWLLDLTAARVKARLAPYDRRLEIDEPLLARSRAAIEAALRDGAHLTRTELAGALERAGIPAKGQRLNHIVSYVELDGAIVSGRRRGKQLTYALLDERAPNARRLSGEEALGELTLRYFTGHGPAQPQDFAWWSGLTVADARRGLALAGSALVREDVGGRPHWSAPDAPRPARARRPLVHLLPNYDEFLIAYRDRSASLDPSLELDDAPFPFGSILAHVVVVDGRVWGGWKRRPNGAGAIVELGLVGPMDDSATAALERAAVAFERFLGAPVTMTRGVSR